MSFLEKLSAQLPFLKKEAEIEYFFALNIGSKNLVAAVWSLEGNKLKILNTATFPYSSTEELTEVTDKLLDKVLGLLEVDPKKILFGVPDSWLLDDNLKEDYLKLLRHLVKELELEPMAYVSTSHALAHLLEKKNGAPATAILVGVGDEDTTVTVVRAGKLDGSKVIHRSDSLGGDIEKGLLIFTQIEVLPSKIYLYGNPTAGLAKLRNDLLPFPWMEKLSFLHFPKIELLESGADIKAVSLAGAVELNSNVIYEQEQKSSLGQEGLKTLTEEKEGSKRVVREDSGFVVGDVMEQNTSGSVGQYISESEEKADTPTHQHTDTLEEDESASQAEDRYDEIQEDRSLPGRASLEEEDFVEHPTARTDNLLDHIRQKLPLPYLRIPGGGFKSRSLIIGGLAVVLLAASYIFLPSAQVKVFVEPKILEKDAQVIADPKVAEVDEEGKKIPGKLVETTVTGSSKGKATGTKEIGDPSKGSVIVYNKTDAPKTFSKGTALSNSSGLKFILDSSVTVASQSAVEGGIAFGKTSASVTAATIGADGNLSSGTDLIISGLSSSQFSAKTEGNFSGGTSKEVTVVTDNDQKTLLAQLSSELRKQSQQELQEKNTGMKILEEALTEEVTKKSYSKNINDQASEFTLNLTLKLKGIAYSDDDLKRIVSKLVDTNVPEGFELNLSETETQADVSKVEKDRLVFLARFRAKLTPKFSPEELIGKIRGKTPVEAAEVLRGYENVLGSEINIIPSLPAPLQRLPVWDRNIKIEVSLK